MLSLRHITKSFGANRAVDDVSLRVERGEIVGLVGENGAGKTTLMRIAAGELAPDSGDVDAAGVALVHQHFMLVSAFTIAENLALAGASPVLDLGDLSREVGSLSVGEKAKLELAKAISKSPSVLILDEPTAVLTPYESVELFEVVRSLAAAGTAVVFISHKLPEVLSIATRIVVMRGGRVVTEAAANTMTAEQLATSMLSGGPLPSAANPRHIAKWPLRAAALHPGEIVAVLGVAGNGQAELIASIPRTPATAFIPEDRTRDGIVAQMTIAENIALTANRWRPKEAYERAQRLIERYSIRAQSPSQKAGDLSGGNQQKVILARELDRNPEVIVAAEPTRGLDIASTRFVHEQLREAANRGASILLITSDLDEAFALADAIQVIYRGKLSERMTPEEASSRVANLMAGVA